MGIGKRRCRCLQKKTFGGEISLMCPSETSKVIVVFGVFFGVDFPIKKTKTGKFKLV